MIGGDHHLVEPALFEQIDRHPNTLERMGDFTGRRVGVILEMAVDFNRTQYQQIRIG